MHLKRHRPTAKLVLLTCWTGAFISCKPSPPDIPKLSLVFAGQFDSRPVEFGQDIWQNRFHVLLANDTIHTQCVWSPSCAFGAQALRFECVDSTGAVLTVSRSVPPLWTHSPPVFYAIPPNRYFIFDVDFSSNQWTGFPSTIQSVAHVYRMRAVLDYPDTEKARE